MGVGWHRVPQTPGKRSGFPGIRKRGKGRWVTMGPLQAKRSLRLTLHSRLPSLCALWKEDRSGKNVPCLGNDEPPSLAGGRGRAAECTHQEDVAWDHRYGCC